MRLATGKSVRVKEDKETSFSQVRRARSRRTLSSDGADEDVLPQVLEKPF